MLGVARYKFLIITVTLFVYVLGVVVLSTVSLHGLRRGKHTDNKPLIPDDSVSHRRSPPLKSKTANLDYGPGAFRPVLKRFKIRWCSDLRYLPDGGAGGDRSRKPTALVSFPGSGNTWLRYLLQQATGYYTGSVYKDYGLLKNGFPAESVANGSVLVVKTHEWGARARAMFSKAILLVRSPGAAIQAEFNRQSGGHIGFASPDRYRRLNGKHWGQFVYDKLRGWQQLNLDWLYNFTGPTHVIFYEHLVDRTAHVLRAAIDFIGDVDAATFDCAIERKEGIYRRKRRLLNFDPFTVEMKRRIDDVRDAVYDAIYKSAAAPLYPDLRKTSSQVERSTIRTYTKKNE